MAKEVKKKFVRRYMPTIIALALLIGWTAVVAAIAHHNGLVEAKERYEQLYEQRLEQYKAEQAAAVQAEYFKSGAASREAFLNQEIDAAARLCSKMNNDTQRGGIICNALARVMSADYPDTMQEVVEQPQQWMFYSPDNKITAHDREIAESILRPYYEDGIIPNGLTADYVYGSWSENDYVLRNTWDYNSGTRTWRYG